MNSASASSGQRHHGRRHPAAGNIIDASTGAGVSIDSASSGNTVAANFIGLNGSNRAVANGGDGVLIEGPNNTIGGSATGAINVICGNTSDGIDISGSGNVVSGNLIGTDASGDLGRAQP